MRSHIGGSVPLEAGEYALAVSASDGPISGFDLNISSYEVESVLMSHGKLADVAVHAVPSPRARAASIRHDRDFS